MPKVTIVKDDEKFNTKFKKGDTPDVSNSVEKALIECGTAKKYTEKKSNKEG